MIKATENVNGQVLCCDGTLCSDFSVWSCELLVYLPSKKKQLTPYMCIQLHSHA